MSKCDRFEREEVLLSLEQDLPLDAHFRTCPDCLDARMFHERLQREIATLGPVSPPPGWEHGVWAKIAAREVAARPRRWRLVAAASALAAALIAVVARLPPLLQTTASATLAMSIGETGATQRGEVTPGSTVVLGSRLELSATTGGGRYAELRVYRNDDQLILQASRVGGRASTDDVLRATLLLDAVGRYHPVLLISRQPLPPPSGSRDDDYVAAQKAGAQTILGSDVSVR